MKSNYGMPISLTAEPLGSGMEAELGLGGPPSGAGSGVGDLAAELGLGGPPAPT